MPAGARQDSDAAATAESIHRWIGELGSEQYAVREAATQNLIRAGRGAIGPVVEAGTADDLEVGTRVFIILMRLAEKGDPPTQAAALEALERVAASPDSPAGRRASSVVGQYKAARHEEALAEIRSLGGTALQSDGSTQIRLGPNWKGGREGLKQLHRLNELQYLSLEKSPAGDADLAELQGLADLQRLYLGDSQIAGPGLAHLKDLPKLNYLSLMGLPIDDAAMEYVAGIQRLECLGLDGTRVGDAGLRFLQDMPHLKKLWLDRTHVTDMGLAYLKDLKSLEYLALVGTDVDGSGLSHLKDLAGLDFISLKGVHLSNAGAEALAAVDPGSERGIGGHAAQRRPIGRHWEDVGPEGALVEQHRNLRRRTGASSGSEGAPEALSLRDQGHRRRDRRAQGVAARLPGLSVDAAECFGATGMR